MTDPTAPESPDQERSVPVEKLLSHYREQVSNLSEQLFVARELYTDAENECRQLRLRVVELELQPAAKK
jgi:hypothetical protein